MELYAKRRKIGEKPEDHVMLPIVVHQLNALSRQLDHLNIREGGKDDVEVTKITSKHKIIRHVVNLKNMYALAGSGKSQGNHAHMLWHS